MDIFFGTDTSPSSGDSSPVIIRKMVVLPAPFGPTRPTFSPGLSWKEVSTKRTCRPYCLLMRERESTRNYLEFTATVRLRTTHGQRSVCSCEQRTGTSARYAGSEDHNHEC